MFVPLCGKSLDLAWLCEQGMSVVGIDLSPLAVQNFFEENHIPFKEGQPPFTIYNHR